jgi:UDP-GlcNAc:undecaprenyl-phosphate GlcNAc-1-phosphate transferase
MFLSLGLVLLAASALAAVITPFIRDAAIRRGVLDQADSARKIHRHPTPRLGGIAVVSAFYLIAAVVAAVYPMTLAPIDLGIFLAGAAMALLGIYDDLRNADARLKFAVQASIALSLYAAGLRIETVWVPGFQFTLGWLRMPVTVLWIVGVTNAVNVIDGLDGLAAGIAIIALAGIALMFDRVGNPSLLLVTVALIGAVAGFLVHNQHPASIFLGDCGSLFLGGMLATLSIRATQLGAGEITSVTPLLLLAIPLIDTATAFARRLRRGESPFNGDRLHIHHRILSRFGSHRAAVQIIHFVAVLFAMAGVLAVVATGTGGLIAIGTAAGLTLLLLVRLVGPTVASTTSATDIDGRPLASIVSIFRPVKRSRRTLAGPTGPADLASTPERRSVGSRDSIY